MKRNMNEKRLYRIYKIESDIDLTLGLQLANFLPIYIGCTCKTLLQRFKCHAAGKRSLYPFIKKYGKEHFKIQELISTFATEKDAHKMEEEISIDFAKTYKLLNKINGNKQTEELKLQMSIRNSPYEIEFNEQIYKSALIASKALNINKNSLVDLINGRTKESHLYIVDYVSYNDKPIYHLKRLKESKINERISKSKRMKIIFTIDNLQFFSVQEFANYFHCTNSNVWNFIKNKSNTLKGFKLKKIIQHKDCKEYILSKIPNKYILHMDKMDVYNSEYAAIKSINKNAKNGSNVVACCQGKVSSVLGNHFRYLTAEEIKLYEENPNNRFSFDCLSLYKILQKQYIFHIESELIFESTLEAMRYINPSAKNGGHIRSCCEGKDKSVFGNHFRYLTIDEIKEYVKKKRGF